MTHSYVNALRECLPPEYASQMNELSELLTGALDSILRFALGGNCPAGASLEVQKQWTIQQPKLSEALQHLTHTSNHKRLREEDDDTSSDPRNAKKTKADLSNGVSLSNEDDRPLYTLHSLSVTSPLRKKVNITIHESSICFTNPSTNALESSIYISSLKRAFLLPTRGKSKPHWTVVILSSDTPAPTGKAASSASNAREEQPQIIFGVDATPPPFSITDHTSSSNATSHPKGTPILTHIRKFLSHLPFETLEPSPSIFRSAASPSGEGVAGVEGYRGAKSGTLWFLSEGVLWDGKPCEFWALSDLVGGGRKGKGKQVDVDLGGAEGVRTVSATGRTCSVILRRKVAREPGEDESDGEDEEDSVDTDVGMVDGKEQEGIAKWVKKHRHLFGVEHDVEAPGMSNGKDKGKGKGKAVAEEVDDKSDEDDSDFAASTTDDGSATSSDSESEDGGNEHEGGDNDGSEDLGSGSGSQSGSDEEEDGEVEELDPKHHPLLRPGAMPKMSKAAMDAVVGMMQDDLMGSVRAAGGTLAKDTGSDDEDEEEDELDD